MTAPRTWDMFAARVEFRDGREFAHFYPHPGLVQMCGYTPVPVTLIEDGDADLLGWIDANDPDDICMIEHKQIFSIQFPYGVQPEIERDNGEVVPVRAVVRKPDPATKVRP